MSIVEKITMIYSCTFVGYVWSNIFRNSLLMVVVKAGTHVYVFNVSLGLYFRNMI